MSTKEYTPEQEKEVKRILKIEKSEFYKILNCEKGSTDVEIKKSYRKLAIKLHPDKNKHPQASEAFKKIAKAFEVLSDDNKRKIYDQTGYDPDSRGGGAGGAASAAAGTSPFAQSFSGAYGGRNPFMNTGNGAFDDELFNMFFGGGPNNPFGGGGNAFTFSFDGTGFRSTGFGPGGAAAQQRQRQRQRQRQQQQQQQQQDPASLRALLMQYLPLLIVLIPLLLNSLYEMVVGSSSSPKFAFETSPDYPIERTTPNYNIPYYISRETQNSFGDERKLRHLDQSAESKYVDNLRIRCRREQNTRDRLIEESYGFFFPDREKLERAQRYEMKNCDRLHDMHLL